MSKAKLLNFGDERGVLQIASKIISAGGLVVFPTDTVYGLGCDPFNGEALHRLILAKKRQKGSLPVLVDSRKTARELASFDKTAETLAEAFWPGPLTLVLPSTRRMPSEVVSNGMIGLRIPDREDTLALIRECNGALVGTSANISGQPASKSAGDAMIQLGDHVDLILDGGISNTGTESTVLQVMEGRILVMREAAVSKERILNQHPSLVFR